MKDVMDALYEFWSQFGVPAYAEDQVPDDAALPYIRYSVAKSPAMETTILTAFNYHEKRLLGNVERVEMAGKIADAIPEKGVKIQMDGGGFLTLFRNVDFQTLYQDPEDFNVIGVRTSVEVHFYSM